MFEGYEELNTQDVERMQEVIRTLLAQTFLPERKYDKKYGRMMPDRMYDFSDRHLEFLTEYFAVAGKSFNCWSISSLTICRSSTMPATRPLALSDSSICVMMEFSR